MPTGGEITIKSANIGLSSKPDSDNDPGEEHVVLSVTDTGTGMTEEIKSRVFEALFTTWKNTNIGLGLNICERVASHHGGQIHIDSKPGEGNCVEVYLPRTDESGIRLPA